MALLSKPDGEHASQIATLLGWQPHTLRAAISRLRRQGIVAVVSARISLFCVNRCGEMLQLLTKKADHR